MTLLLDLLTLRKIGWHARVVLWLLAAGFALDVVKSWR